MDQHFGNSFETEDIGMKKSDNLDPKNFIPDPKHPIDKLPKLRYLIGGTFRSSRPVIRKS